MLMSRFKEGDLIVCTSRVKGVTALNIGDEYIVHYYQSPNVVKLKGVSGVWSESQFELVRDPPTEHRHAALIKAWAEGAEIQCWSEGSGLWRTNARPQWETYLKYRVKPKDLSTAELRLRVDELEAQVVALGGTI